MSQPPSEGHVSSRARITTSLVHRARALARSGSGGLTQRQVAALLGISQPTVAVTERRALAKLRRALEHEMRSRRF